MNRLDYLAVLSIVSQIISILLVDGYRTVSTVFFILGLILITPVFIQFVKGCYGYVRQ